MFKQAEYIVLDSPDALRVLRNLNLTAYLKPFFTKPCNLSQAAIELGIDIGSYYYWLKKFLKLGLLVKSHEQKRAGSSIKYYITPAKIIVLKLESGQSSLKQYYEFANQDYSKLIIDGFISSVESLNEDFGLSFKLNQQGDINIKPVLLNQNTNIEQALLGPNSPAAYAVWKNLKLDFSDAKDLQAKFAALIHEYEEKVKPGQTSHLVQVTIVPET